MTNITVTTGSSSKVTWVHEDAWERAQAICARHIADYPDMPNVPLQSVFEMLLEVQGRADLIPLARGEE